MELKMSLSPRKHDKLNNPKHASVSLDSFLGILSSAYGTEKLDSSIIFDKDTVNWTNISVENLRTIPKEDTDNKAKKGKPKETVTINAATSTTNLRLKNTNDGEDDETLFSIRSLVSIQKIKNKLESNKNEKSASKISQEDKPALDESFPSTDIGDTPDSQMKDPPTSEENVENQHTSINPVCGFFVDDCNHKVIFDIQFVKKATLNNDIMPVFDIGEPEIVISVNDTSKSMKADVKMSKANLVSKVQYFADVEKEFGLENLYVIVKCNFGVFQWVLQWIMSDIPMCKPNLNVNILKAILSMAHHLGINQLVKECLHFFHHNLNLVLESDREIEDVLDDTLLLQLTKLLKNSEVEHININYDSLKTKLFCTLIKLLAEPEPCREIGHFSSLSKIFQCGFCEKIMHISIKDAVPCRADRTQLSFDGKLEFHHECSSFWNLAKYIEVMYEQLKDWRLIYWQLWGMCHFFYCEACQSWYPMSQSEWCPYHTGEVEYFTMKNQLYYPIGTYSCCGEKTFRFDIVKPYGGCKYQNHVSKLDTIEEVEKYNILQEFKQVINISPPGEQKVKKFVKLLKKSDDTSILQSETLSETFWWEGILLAPEEKIDMSLVPLKVLNNLRNRPEDKSQPKTHAAQKYGVQVPYGSLLPYEEKKLENNSKEDLPTYSRHINANKRSKPKLLAKKGKSSNIILGPRTKTKKKKSLSYVYQPTESIWSGLESNKDNQDNQRDFEEIAMRKLVDILTPAESSGIHLVSSAGSYIRLETEWWQRNCGSHMDKTSSTVVNRTFPLAWFRRLTI